LALAEALGSLMEDLPADAFPGEDTADDLLEMAAGTCAPVIQAAGEALCRDALGLVGAVREKFIADLRTAGGAQHHDIYRIDAMMPDRAHDGHSRSGYAAARRACDA
jgi:hypothetical protein